MAGLLRGLAQIENSMRMMAHLLDEWSDVARLQMGEPLHLDRRSSDLVALARHGYRVQHLRNCPQHCRLPHTCGGTRRAQ
jgi:hypothetical protein